MEIEHDGERMMMSRHARCRCEVNWSGLDGHGESARVFGAV